MKKLVLAFVLFSSSYFCHSQPNPDGAFVLTKARYGPDLSVPDSSLQWKAVKVMKDGFWFSVFYGDVQKPFDGIGYGNFTCSKGEYRELVRFYSWDSSLVGQLNTFKYAIDNGVYRQWGKINSDKYVDYVIEEESRQLTGDCKLLDTGVEGVWKLNAGPGSSPNVTMLVFAYPFFTLLSYNNSNSQLERSVGGQYQYDGKTLKLHTEFSSGGVGIGVQLNVSVQRKGKEISTNSLLAFFNGEWFKQ